MREGERAVAIEKFGYFIGYVGARRRVAYASLAHLYRMLSTAVESYSPRTRRYARTLHTRPVAGSGKVINSSTERGAVSSISLSLSLVFLARVCCALSRKILHARLSSAAATTSRVNFIANGKKMLLCIGKHPVSNSYEFSQIQ